MARKVFHPTTALAKDIIRLKEAVDFCDSAEERGEQVGMRTSEDPEPVMVQAEFFIRKGIADLDFDPLYYLGTGNTSPEGWALSKAWNE
jgi:hypothetical protein